MDGAHNMSVENFEILSITLPYVSGTCTVPNGVDWEQGYHTPITCQESADSEWTYYFGVANVPISVKEIESGHPIYRRIKSISESSPILQTDGIASRGSLTVTFNDWEGDPGPVNTTENGTYLSKFAARNFINGKVVKLYRYTRENGINTLVSTSVFLAETLSVSSAGIYTLSCKSRLERTYKDYTQFPEPTEALLRLDIDETETEIPVYNDDYDWASLPVIRIGDEFLKPTAYDETNQLLTVATRGTSITGVSGVITKTITEDHSAGDDIQVCYISDNQEIAEFLELILLFAEMPESYIDVDGWQAEFDDYWSGTKLINIWSEPTEVKDILDTLCNDYMLDIWEESTEPAKIRVSAVSTWKQPSVELVVGRGITESKFAYSGEPDLMTSRAYIYYDKPYKAEDDDRGNFKKLSLNIDPTYEGSDYYDTIKATELTPSFLLNTNDASLRTQRHVARYSLEPVSYTWDCEEKYLDYQTGDIVEFGNQDLQDAEGNSKLVRAQITSVNPKYKYGGIGRAYSVKALTYLPAVISGGTGSFTKVLSGVTLSEIDVHNDYADRTNTVVDFVLILDNCIILSDDTENPSIRNGSFATGSTVTIILAGDTNWQAKGGAGGDGAVWTYEAESGEWLLRNARAGGDGGTCFNADGVDTDIYISGSTGNASYPTASGYLRAPGGGGGGSNGASEGDAGDGGGGGAGYNFGVGGSAGRTENGATTTYGEIGIDGTITGTGGAGGDGGSAFGGDGGDWGQAGETATGYLTDAVGGSAGKGIVKSGATVKVYGSTAARFINGGGDTPD